MERRPLDDGRQRTKADSDNRPSNVILARTGDEYTT